MRHHATSPTGPGPRRALAVLGGAVLALAGASAAQAATVDPDLATRLACMDRDDRVRVVVRMSDQVDAVGLAPGRSSRERTLRDHATRTQSRVVRRLRAIGPAHSLWILNAVAGTATAADIRALRSDPAVAEIALDGAIARVTATEPSAPESVALEPFAEVAALDPDVTPAPLSSNWGIQDIRADDAWAAYRVDGSGITVGSIDTGVDPRNPALTGKIVAFRDFVNGRTAAYDDNGHGTHTIGTMVGADVDGHRLGIAPGAKVLVAKAMNREGVGDGTDILLAAQWIADPDGDPNTKDHPAVVNNSWSSPDPNDAWFRPIMRNWLALGIVPVFATGNTGEVGSPASYPEVLAVGAMDEAHRVPGFSGRAEVRWENRDGSGPPAGTQIVKPDLVGPGVEIEGGYGIGFLPYTGTSMAAPHVAGVVALMRQANPAMTVEEITAAVRETAIDIGRPGPERASGAGRLDALGAVARALGQPLGDSARGPDSATVPSVSVRVSGGAHVTVVGRPRVRTPRLQIVVRRSGSSRIVKSRTVRATNRGFSFVMRGALPGRYRVEVRVRTAKGTVVVARKTVRVGPSHG